MAGTKLVINEALFVLALLGLQYLVAGVPKSSGLTPTTIGGRRLLECTIFYPDSV